MTEIEIQSEEPCPVKGRACMSCHTILAYKRIVVGPVEFEHGGEYYDLCKGCEPKVFEMYRDDMQADREAAVSRVIKESYYGGRA